MVAGRAGPSQLALAARSGVGHVPGDNVAEQQSADQPRVVPEESGSLGRRARKGRHPYRIGDRYLVETMRGTGMDGLAAPF
jgi:hypothetical protein